MVCMRFEGTALGLVLLCVFWIAFCVSFFVHWICGCLCFWVFISICSLFEVELFGLRWVL